MELNQKKDLTKGSAVSYACITCGVDYASAFCPNCGEKRINRHDYSLTHFAENAVEIFTHFDFKVFRAVKMVLLQPGFLTREYLMGRRKPHLAPVQLFVVVSVAFALLIGYTGWTPLNTPLVVQENSIPFSQWKRDIVAEEIHHRQVSREEFQKAFNSSASVQAKTWVFAMIPLFALICAGLYGFRRYYLEHLIFGVHFYTFVLLMLLTLTVVWSRIAIVLSRSGHPLPGFVIEELASSSAVLLVLVYLFLGLRKAFGDGIGSALLRSLALTIAVVPILFLYRFLLFFVSIKAMH